MKQISLFSILFLIIISSQNINSEELYLKEYEDEYKNIIENFLGYYIISERPDDMWILRLSLQGHLIIHEMVINNNELSEVNRIVLDSAIKNKDNEIFFLSSKYKYEFRNPIRFFKPPYVYFNPNNRSKPYPENFAIGYKSEIKKGDRRLILDNSVFVKNPDEVINAINLYFSPEAQRKYTGKYVFSEYELIEIKNMEVPFTIDEIKKDEIIIDMDDKNRLSGKHISTYHMNRFYIDYVKYGINLITGMNVDGVGFFYNYSYSFVDLNTIIFEWEWGGKTDNDKRGYIHYKIIFKKEI